MLIKINARIFENEKETRASIATSDGKSPDFTVNPAYRDLVIKQNFTRPHIRSQQPVHLRRRKQIIKPEDKEVSDYIKDLKNSETFGIYGLTSALPENNINSKFVYFYKPYNFNINTKMYMTYDRDVAQDKIKCFDDFVRMKKINNVKQQQRDEALKKKSESVESP